MIGSKTVFVTPQSDWEVRLSNSRGVPYFYNNLTQESVWDSPSGLTEEQIARLPGASLLKPKPKEVRASHILVKHSGSRRPSSWKEASLTLYPLPVPCRSPKSLQGPFFHFLSITFINNSSGVLPPFFLSFFSDSRISLAPKRKRSRSCGDTSQRSGGARKSLASSHASTRIAPRTSTRAIWAGSGLGRCRSRLKMPRLGCGLGRSVMLSTRRAGCTSSCAPNDSWGEREEKWVEGRGRARGRLSYRASRAGCINSQKLYDHFCFLFRTAEFSISMGMRR